MGRETSLITAFCPAKLNLFLSIRGKRDDGFHELDSIVAKCQFGDDLEAFYDPDLSEDFLTIKGASLSTKNNTILRAAELLRTRSGFSGGFKFNLIKRIPHGAGLGGGSSNAVETLKLINESLNLNYTINELSEISSEIGSDCPLFFTKGPIRMKGRGEICEQLPVPLENSLRGLAVCIFKPFPSISTIKAYQEVRKHEFYSDLAEKIVFPVEPKLDYKLLLYNDFERILPFIFPSNYLVLKKLRAELGLAVGMSGSGSALFALLDESKAKITAIRDILDECWGVGYQFIQTQLE